MNPKRIIYIPIFIDDFETDEKTTFSQLFGIPIPNTTNTPSQKDTKAKPLPTLYEQQRKMVIQLEEELKRELCTALKKFYRWIPDNHLKTYFNFSIRYGKYLVFEPQMQ